MDSVWKHPQLNALNRIVATPTPTGLISSFKPPTNNSEFEASLSAVPALGEHTLEILEELEFSTAEIENFFTSEVV